MGFTKTDYTKLSKAELLDAYNSMADLIGRPMRKAPFRSRVEGTAACKKAQALIPGDADTDSPGGKIIRVLTRSNPREPDSTAHRYFAAMTDGMPFEEYAARFQDGPDRTAALDWLKRSVNEGYVRFEGAEQ
jgi:hypothetical protein